MFFVSIFLYFLSITSRLSIYAPELVVDGNAILLSDTVSEYGYEIIISVGQPDWYSFVFTGIKTGDHTSGLIFTVNNHGNKDSDMLDKPILFWYETAKNGKSIGEIYFRGHMRKLQISPARNN